MYYSVEVKNEMRLRAAREVECAVAWRRGPYTDAGEIWVPSPYPQPGFKAEMKRYSLRWSAPRQAWHRRMTPGKESAALDWARDVYLKYYGDRARWAVQRLEGEAGVELDAESAEILARLEA